LDGFVTNELLTTERRNNIIKYFTGLKNGINNPLPGTNA